MHKLVFNDVVLFWMLHATEKLRRCTELVSRLLFERGNGDLAVKLLTSDATYSFEEMRREGSTTIWENWPHCIWDRSRNHPMFGAVISHLFDYLLGIREEAGTAGYSAIVIAPVFVKKLNRLKGSRLLPAGEVSVSYKRENGSILVDIVVPETLQAEFCYGGEQRLLKPGRHQFKVAEQ